MTGKRYSYGALVEVEPYDGAIIVTNHSDHSMYYKAKDAVKNAGVPFVHTRKTDNNLERYNSLLTYLTR